MDDKRAQELLTEERERVERLLQSSTRAGDSNRGTAAEAGAPAQPLTAQQQNDAVAQGLRKRLAAIERAEARLQAGTYGRSVLSNAPIPDERLEADPAAELTVEEAAQADA